MRDSVDAGWQWVRQMRRATLTGRLLRASAASAAAALLMVGALTPLAAQAATTWQDSVGAERHAEGVQGNAFLPNELWIDAGDSVTWASRVGEIHTVSFLSGGP